MDKSSIVESILTQHASITEVAAHAIASIIARDPVAFNAATFRTVAVQTQSHDYQDLDIICNFDGNLASDEIISAYGLRLPVWASSRFVSTAKLEMNGASQTFAADGDFTVLPAGVADYELYEHGLRNHKKVGLSALPKQLSADSVPGVLRDAYAGNQATRVLQLGDPLYEAARDLVRGLNYKLIDSQGIIGFSNTGTGSSDNNLGPYDTSKNQYSKPGYYHRLPFTSCMSVNTCLQSAGGTWTRVSILVPIDGRRSDAIFFMPSLTSADGVSKFPSKTWLEVVQKNNTSLSSPSNWTNAVKAKQKWTRFTGLPFEEVRYASAALPADEVTINLGESMTVKIGTGTAILPADLTRVYSISSYELLLTGKLGNAMGVVTRERIAKIVESWTTSGGAISEVSYGTPVDVSTYRLQDLEYARSYKRQREKACKTDDFLTKQSPYMGLTFGAVQTKMNAVTTRKVWYLPRMSLTGDTPTIPNQGSVSVSYDEATKTVTVSGAASSTFVHDLNQPATEAFADWVSDWMHLAYQNTDAVTRRVLTAVDADAVNLVNEELMSAEKYTTRGQELTAISPFSGQFGTIDMSNKGEIIKTHAANCTVYANTQQQLKLLRMQFTLGKIERNFTS